MAHRRPIFTSLASSIYVALRDALYRLFLEPGNSGKSEDQDPKEKETTDPE